MAIPEGYVKDSLGRLIPEGMVKEIDLLRDQTVRELIDKAKETAEMLKRFKGLAMAEVASFKELAFEKYEVEVGAGRGNLTLTSYDGSLRVRLAVSDRITFTEGIVIAKTLIDECIQAWAETADDKIKALINDAFQVDSEGKVNTYRVLSLMKINIQDDKWKMAMDALRDSITTLETKQYIRFYERDEQGKYQAISLDIAKM